MQCTRGTELFANVSQLLYTVCNMIAKNNDFATILRQSGYSVTLPRKTVYDALSAHAVLTMAELVQACPAINRASVYRAVELFEKLSIVKRIYTGWKYRIELGEAFHDHHHHITCSRCSRYVRLEEDTELEKALQRLAAKSQYVMTGHELEMHGICSTCQTPGSSTLDASG